MLVIGEKINSIIPSVREMVKVRDKRLLQKLALDQIEQGARALDVNVDDTERADPETSKGNVMWAIKTVQEVTSVPLMVDSADPRVLAAGLCAYDFSKGKPFLNSLNENNKEQVVEFLLKYKCNVVVLVDLRAEKTVKERVETARVLKAYLEEKGVVSERIYVDAAVGTVGVNPRSALRVIKSIKKIKKELGLKGVCAPSNVSFGLPNRKLLNEVFISMLKEAGIDAVIANPKNVSVRVPTEAFKAASLVLRGKDRRMKQYRVYLKNSKNP